MFGGKDKHELDCRANLCNSWRFGCGSGVIASRGGELLIDNENQMALQLTNAGNLCCYYF
jgi:hypothetical protein